MDNDIEFCICNIKQGAAVSQFIVNAHLQLNTCVNLHIKFIMQAEAIVHSVLCICTCIYVLLIIICFHNCIILCILYNGLRAIVLHSMLCSIAFRYILLYKNLYCPRWPTIEIYYDKYNYVCLYYMGKSYHVIKIIHGTPILIVYMYYTLLLVNGSRYTGINTVNGGYNLFYQGSMHAMYTHSRIKKGLCMYVTYLLFIITMRIVICDILVYSNNRISNLRIAPFKGNRPKHKNTIMHMIRPDMHMYTYFNIFLMLYPLYYIHVTLCHVDLSYTMNFMLYVLFNIYVLCVKIPETSGFHNHLQVLLRLITQNSVFNYISNYGKKK